MKVYSLIKGYWNPLNPKIPYRYPLKEPEPRASGKARSGLPGLRAKVPPPYLLKNTVTSGFWVKNLSSEDCGVYWVFVTR